MHCKIKSLIGLGILFASFTSQAAWHTEYVAGVTLGYIDKSSAYGYEGVIFQGQNLLEENVIAQTGQLYRDSFTWGVMAGAELLEFLLMAAAAVFRGDQHRDMGAGMIEGIDVIRLCRMAV